MRKFLVLALFLFLFTAVSAGPPFQGEFSVLGRCASCCIETYPINFTITIDNTISESRYYYYTIKEYWVKTEAGTTLNRIRYQNITLPQHTILNLYLTSEIPIVLNDSFGYSVCMKYDYVDNYDITREEELCSSLEIKSAFPISDYFGKEICCSNNECEATERCRNDYVCESLNCGPCQYILNHNCYDYECCADTDCNETSTCVNNVCTPISCAGEIVNRTCTGIFGLPAVGLPEWFRDVFGEPFAAFIESNLVLLIMGVVFIIVFIILIVWLLKGGGEEKKTGPIVPSITLGGKEVGKKAKKKPKEDKKKDKTKKKTKKGKKKKKEPKKEEKKSEEEGPEYVPLVELPE